MCERCAERGRSGDGIGDPKQGDDQNQHEDDHLSRMNGWPATDDSRQQGHHGGKAKDIREADVPAALDRAHATEPDNTASRSSPCIQPDCLK